MESILKITFVDGTVKFVTSVSNKRVGISLNIGKVFNSKECSAITAGKGMVDHILASRGLTGYKIEEVNVFQAFRQSMERNPVFRIVNENGHTAQHTGIKPWHHCLAYGDKIYCVVWDTRQLELILDKDEIDYSEAFIVRDDSCQPLRYDKDKFTHVQLADLELHFKSNISREQFNQIIWP